jgi:uncharacterized protein (UPF0248 family)
MDTVKHIIEELKYQLEYYQDVHVHRIKSLSEVDIKGDMPMMKQDFYLFVNGRYVPYRIVDKFMLK